MGVIPLQFTQGMGVEDLRLDGSERFDFLGLDDLAVGDNSVTLIVHRTRGEQLRIELGVRIDSLQEIRYLTNGGVLPFVIRKVVARTRH
jgi:aconitate hydratase